MFKHKKLIEHKSHRQQKSYKLFFNHSPLFDRVFDSPSKRTSNVLQHFFIIVVISFCRLDSSLNRRSTINSEVSFLYESIKRFENIIIITFHKADYSRFWMIFVVTENKTRNVLKSYAMKFWKFNFKRGSSRSIDQLRSRNINLPVRTSFFSSISDQRSHL